MVKKNQKLKQKNKVLTIKMSCQTNKTFWKRILVNWLIQLKLKINLHPQMYRELKMIAKVLFKSKIVIKIQFQKLFRMMIVARDLQLILNQNISDQLYKLILK